MTSAGKKQFRLAAAEIKPLATGHGGCIATDRITVNGRRVGYMYREETERERRHQAVAKAFAAA